MPKFSAYMKGGDGSVGPPGASIIDGVLADESMLPVPNQGKYAFLVGTSDPKRIWVWNEKKEGVNKWDPQGTTASEVGRVTASISTIPWDSTPSVQTQFSTSSQIDYFNFDFNLPMGRPAGFGEATATISSTNWDAEPAISTSTSGEDWAKNLHYDFTIPVGRPAGFGDIHVTTSTLPSGRKPWVKINSVTNSPEYEKDFNFEFGLPLGVAAGFSTGQYVSVSTLDSGEDATVEITTVTSSPETAKEFNFHFGLPRGDSLAIYEGIPFTTEDDTYYHWDTTNTTTLVFDRGTVKKLPIYIYNSDNESIAATFKLSASTIEYEADEKFNGTMYLAMPTTLQNVEIGTVSSTTYGYEPVVSKSTGSTSTNLILDFVIPEGYPGHTVIDSITTNIQTLSTNLNSVSTTVSNLYKIYRLPSELGFTTKPTMSDVAIAMPNGSIGIFNNTEIDDSALTYTGKPSVITIYKNSGYRTYAIGSRSYMNVNLANTKLYFASFDHDAQTWRGWKKLISSNDVLHISMPSTSSLGQISNNNVTSTMRVINIVWGTPKSVVSNVSWNTADGKLTLSGTLSGATTAEIDLIDFE